MKKGSKQLIMLGAVAVILGTAYAGIIVWKGYSENKKAQEQERAEEAAKIYLCEADNPIRLEVVNEMGTFMFSYDEETEVWNYDKDEHFPVLQSKITSITSRVDPLLAVRKLEGAEADLSVYGLTEPKYTLTITDAENTPVTIYFGNKSEANSNYYVRLEGDENVYTISSDFSTILGITEDTMLQKETFPTIAAADVISLTWKVDKEEMVLRQDTREVETETETEGELQTEGRSESESEAEGELEIEQQTECYWLYDENELEDTTELDNLLTLISELEYTDCADYYLEDGEAEQYGLDEMYTVFTIISETSDEEAEYVFEIGALTEDESAYYVRMNDSSMVNLMAAASVEQIRGFFEN